MPYFLTRQGCLVYCITVILTGLSQIGGLSCEIRDAESVSCSEVCIKADADGEIVKVIDAGPFGKSLFVMNFIKDIHCLLFGCDQTGTEVFING